MADEAQDPFLTKSLFPSLDVLQTSTRRTSGQSGLLFVTGPMQ
jgi:hypothetical protein